MQQSLPIKLSISDLSIFLCVNHALIKMSIAQEVEATLKLIHTDKHNMHMQNRSKHIQNK